MLNANEKALVVKDTINLKRGEIVTVNGYLYIGEDLIYDVVNSNGKSESLDESYLLKHDVVEHPSHYTTGGIEVLDFIKAKTKNLPGDEGYLVGNILKYACRYSYKNGVEDLKKARFYLEDLIKILESQN